MIRSNFIIIIVTFSLISFSSYTQEQLSCYKKNNENYFHKKHFSKKEYQHRARQLFLSGDYEKSKILLNQASEKYPSVFNFQTLLFANYQVLKEKRKQRIQLEKMIQLRPEEKWLQIEKAKLNNKLVDVCFNNQGLALPLVLECAKSIKNKISSDKLLNKVIEKSKNEKLDPFSPLYLAKALELKDQKRSAIQVLENVNQNSPAYEDSLRNIIRISADLGNFNFGQSKLNILFSLDSLNPINHLIAFDFYKIFHSPHQALYHYSLAQNCLNESSVDLKARKGYILEVLGYSFSNNISAKLSFSSFISHFRPQEQLQNSLQGLPLNLYHFRNSILKSSLISKINNKNISEVEVGANYKTGDRSEVDFWIKGSLKTILSSQLINEVSISYSPVYNYNKKSMLRQTYQLKNHLEYKPKSKKTSFNLDLNYGREQQLSTNLVSNFYEANLYGSIKSQDETFDLTAGSALKLISQNDQLDQIRPYLGFNYNFLSGLRIGLYNEAFILKKLGGRTISSTLQINKTLSQEKNLKLSLGSERSLNHFQFKQYRSSLSFNKTLFLKKSKIKTEVQFNHISDKGPARQNNTFINFKVGIPF